MLPIGGAKSVCRPGAGPGSFTFAIAGWSVRYERVEEPVCRLGHLVYRPTESAFVRFGRPREAAQLSDELEGGRADLFVRGGWFEVMQSLDVSTHRNSSPPPNDVASPRQPHQPPRNHDALDLPRALPDVPPLPAPGE